MRRRLPAGSVRKQTAENRPWETDRLTPLSSGSDTGRIQLNEEVSVTPTYEIDLGLFAGFGSFSHHPAGDATGKF